MMSLIDRKGGHRRAFSCPGFPIQLGSLGEPCGAVSGLVEFRNPLAFDSVVGVAEVSDRAFPDFVASVAFGAGTPVAFRTVVAVVGHGNRLLSGFFLSIGRIPARERTSVRPSGSYYR